MNTDVVTPTKEAIEQIELARVRCLVSARAFREDGNVSSANGVLEVFTTLQECEMKMQRLLPES